MQNELVVQAQRNFRREFNVERYGRIPTRQTVMRQVRDFENRGNVALNFREGVRTVRTPERTQRVKQAVLRSPKRSATRQSIALHIASKTLRRILHFDLYLHPYKIQVVHKLKEADRFVHVAFCREFLQILENDGNQLNFLMIEAHFHLSGYVNKQNYRYWSEVIYNRFMKDLSMIKKLPYGVVFRRLVLQNHTFLKKMTKLLQ